MFGRRDWIPFGEVKLLYESILARNNYLNFGESNGTTDSNPSMSNGLNSQLGGIFIWTHTYHLIRSSATKYKAMNAAEESSKKPNMDLDANESSNLLDRGEEDVAITMSTTKSPRDDTNDRTVSLCVQLLYIVQYSKL